MSHLIESMFYKGEVPWHGLGVGVSKAPSILEALALSGLNWNVAKQPVFLENGIKVPDAFAIVRDVDGKVLGSVGNRYVPTQNTEAFEVFQPLIDKSLIELETAGSIMGGSRVWILAKVKNAQGAAIIPGKDEVNLYTLLYHGHDGSLPHCLGFTTIRTVCYNTLTAALYSAESQLLKVKHTKSAKDTLSKLVEIMNVASGEFQATVDQYKALASKTMDAAAFEKYVRIVFSLKSAEESDRQSSVLTKVTELFNSGIGTDIPGVKNTRWGAYNAVTEYLTHSKGRDNDTRLNSNWFGASKDTNNKALQTALNFDTIAA
jgi:phage/plasmid-like protein (TIGR03299 family)